MNRPLHPGLVQKGMKVISKFVCYNLAVDFFCLAETADIIIKTGMRRAQEACSFVPGLQRPTHFMDQDNIDRAITSNAIPRSGSFKINPPIMFNGHQK